MLLKTHVATALSLTLIFDFYISSNYPDYSANIVARAIIYIIVAILQHLIDQIGHTWKKIGLQTIPARNKYHSLPAMIAIGGIVGFISYQILGPIELLYLFITVMLLHWIEDAITEAGVYMVKRRIRLPLRIRYNNILVNRLMITVFYIVAVLHVAPLSSVIFFVFFMCVSLYNIYAFLVL